MIRIAKKKLPYLHCVNSHFVHNHAQQKGQKSSLLTLQRNKQAMPAAYDRCNANASIKRCAASLRCHLRASGSATHARHGVAQKIDTYDNDGHEGQRRPGQKFPRRMSNRAHAARRHVEPPRTGAWP
ncbi:hypothetical protein [Dyella acidiphila]|uniref:Uncharacterized protein n=1 Tax=Dyella acidiphila TaxID=2775866 RepID=A0ABR9G6Z0_9GAMM|nr:hypothetical protein [Dyella acidiphila]MBE1159814.1 hypothetical protein [Dyella acidiphila]